MINLNNSLMTKLQLIILTLLITCFVPSHQLKASESVILKYGFLRESISVKELSTFANTGKMSSSLRAYLKLANKKPDQVRKVLSQEIPVDGVLLSQILNSKAGELLLDVVANYIQTPSGKASRESLRGAFVSSALPDNNIRLIEIFENYPTSEVHIEGDRLAELYVKINNIIKQIPLI